MNDELSKSTLQSDRLEIFKKQITNPIKSWKPRVGDSLIGRIAGYQSSCSTCSSNNQLLITDQRGNTNAVWLTYELAVDLEVNEVEEGDIVAIMFDGKSKHVGHHYKRYSVIVDKIRRADS
jgi:hypothetical protein